MQELCTIHGNKLYFVNQTHAIAECGCEIELYMDNGAMKVKEVGDFGAAPEPATRVVEVTYFCGHIGEIVVDDTAEGVEWALEFAQSENCPKCDASYEREARETHEDEVYS